MSGVFYLKKLLYLEYSSSFHTNKSMRNYSLKIKVIYFIYYVDIQALSLDQRYFSESFQNKGKYILNAQSVGVQFLCVYVQTGVYIKVNKYNIQPI